LVPITETIIIAPAHVALLCDNRLHKSSDALCPSRAKAELTATERNISGINDERHHVGDTDTPDNSGYTPPPTDRANNDVVMGEGRQPTIATDNTDKSQIVR
jgi:hypothetical protein